MSNSGSTQFPAGPKLPGQNIPQRGGDENAARIIGVPNDLRDVRSVIELRGEVVQQRAQNIVTIRTERGDIDVEVPRDRQAPQRGTRVNVEIQPGRPPERINVQTRNADTPPASERHSTTPVDVEVNTSNTMPPRTQTIQHPPDNATPLPRTLPAEGTTARLEPISARQAATIINQTTIETISASLIQNTTNAALIAANAAQTIVSENALSIAPNTRISQQNQSIFQESFPQNTSLNSSNPTLPAAAQITDNTLQTPATTPLTLEAFIGKGLNTKTVLPLRAFNAIQHALNARIESISQPAVQLVDKGASLETPLKQLTELQKPSTTDLKNLKISELNSSITQNTSPTALNAIVTGQTAQSLPVVSIFSPQTGALHHFTLHTPVDSVTPGTQIKITPQTALTTSAPQGTALPTSLTSFLMPGVWPAMQDLYQGLTQTNPALAQVISNITPSPANPGQMTPAALFFIAAVRGGDIGSWMGDKTIDALRREGRSNLLSRLTQDNGMLSRLASDPVSQDWRALSVPLFWEGDMQKMALYYRSEDGDADGKEQKGKQTRFIFDLNLTHMGKLQLDGLFRPLAENTRLDLIVRAEEPFSQMMQKNMRRTYASALGQTEITGELSFQSQPEQWVTINVDEESTSNVVA